MQMRVLYSVLYGTFTGPLCRMLWRLLAFPKAFEGRSEGAVRRSWKFEDLGKCAVCGFHEDAWIIDRFRLLEFVYPPMKSQETKIGHSMVIVGASLL